MVAGLFVLSCCVYYTPTVVDGTLALSGPHCMHKTLVTVLLLASWFFVRETLVALVYFASSIVARNCRWFLESSTS